jgi:hypothetical protein
LWEAAIHETERRKRAAKARMKVNKELTDPKLGVDLKDPAESIRKHIRGSEKENNPNHGSSNHRGSNYSRRNYSNSSDRFFLKTWQRNLFMQAIPYFVCIVVVLAMEKAKKNN